ncbi:MAG: bacillithiol biosynthesis deacetylase BshB1 [candidate division Zixibacteria bacterium]|nr:bacillithiol biosynthesis deacetylase BshB1 [candidate division Zixibacteria bacterium]
MADTKLDILAIAAHPDDIEITSGGLLIKMARRGRQTGALDLTRGEMGTYGSDAEREREAAAAAEIMGLVFRRNLGIKDSAVEYNRENKLKIARVIRETQPEMVILPHGQQRHPDHLACHRLGFDACFLAGLKKIDLDGEPYRPRKIIYASYYRNSEYSFLVDISEEFEQKVRAVSAYKSQFGNNDDKTFQEMLENGQKNIFHPGTTIYDSMHTRNHYLGLLAGVRYAEGYSVKENILIDDPQKMPVRSI